MKALRFLLRGKTAFFKQPDVNTYCYYTYGCIHKIALLGIFGAVMGFRGYNGQTKAETYPEFYEKLKNLKVSICPLNEKGYIPKKVQTFNNSVGYASKEEGGNLIVKEQWLENPKWEIAFLVDDPQSENLAERILESRFEFLPYLGKNDHTAVIENVEEVELEAETKRENLRVYGLFPANQGSLSENSVRRPLGREVPYKYQERLPVALEPACNEYVTQAMIDTNQRVSLTDAACVFRLEERHYVFF